MFAAKMLESKTSVLGRVRRRLFGLAPDEALFARRGFTAAGPQAQLRLERSGRVFLEGYNAALEEVEHASLYRRLNGAEEEFRGFAFEGAAMALGLLDSLAPWAGGRWRDFARDFGGRHIYMMHVGLGWALARLRRRPVPRLAQLDPLLGWLAVDGYGFHEGYFRWRRFIWKREAPRRLHGYACRAFDQGLGRSIWFVAGANVCLISRLVLAFERGRQSDLWSGIGLACAYAGGADRPALESLRGAAGDDAACLAQGAAFAAKARQRAGNPAPHTDAACQVLCGLTGRFAAAVTDGCLGGLPADGPVPTYEVWRRRIRSHFAKEVVSAS